MAAVLSPHRTHLNPVAYVAHLVVWWLSTALSSYGLISAGMPCPSDWCERMPRYWRREAKRGLRDCESVLRRVEEPRVES
jgi:hypothetical protein